jgi:benzoyl-CoA reductase subunit C
MTVLENMSEIARTTINPYLNEAKSAGGRVIGYFCSYVPVEIIHAAGFIPYKMRAVESSGTDLADAYYAPLNCSFVRHCFNKALKGEFDFLDGVVFMNGCDHTRRMYDNWRYSGHKPGFLHLHFVPHIIGGNAEEKFRESAVSLKASLEKLGGVAVTDDRLRDSIRLFNKMRQLIMAIDAARKGAAVPIRGSEMLNLVMAVTALPVETANEVLDEVLIHIQGRNVAGDGDVRIIVLAGCMEEPEHLKLYENMGGAVVADGFCFGSRLYNRTIDESGDPFDALARGYLGAELSCPRMMDDFPRRLGVIADMAKEYSADALIVEKLKFCDMWGWEIERLRREAKKGVIPPVLGIEREYLGGASGQIRTRIQAFFEQIKNNLEVDYTIERSDRSAYYVRK